MTGVSVSGRRDQVWTTLRSLSMDMMMPVIRQKAETMSALRWICSGVRQQLTRSSTYAVSVEVYIVWSAA